MIELLLILFVLTQVSDAYSTLKFLKLGIKEANPFLAWVMEKFGTRKLILAKAILAWITVVLTGANPYVLSALSILFAYVTWYNYKQIRAIS